VIVSFGEAESCLTRAITIVAMICFLIVGAAATSILGRDSLPGGRLELAAASAVQDPVSNKASKKDKLAVTATVALASFDRQQPATLSEPVRQAFAAAGPSDIVPPQIAAPQAPKPKAVARPQPQKSYALLSDVQIAGIKERLNLSPDQESYWPKVENALRAIARKIHATRKADPAASGALIDPDAEEVQQLKSAAMPLLFQLREDQKREVRSLARIIGLEKVASMI
jgi:hypothetical protein